MDKNFPEKSEMAGKIPHSHLLEWDEETGDLVKSSLAPGSESEDHHHEIVHKADDTWFLGPAKDDEDDPDHTHEITIDHEKKSSTKAEKIIKRLK
jgi:hypothetical protein